MSARYLRMSALVLVSWVSSGSPPPSSEAAVSSGMIAVASCLPSSTPHWSKLLMFQTMPWTKILCSYMAMSEPRVFGVIF